MKSYIIAALMISASILATAQDKKQEKIAKHAQQVQIIKELVEADTFLFRVERASSTNGTIAMDKSVGMTINHKKIQVNLPYNGNSSGAQWGATGENVMDFTSTNFEMSKESVDGKRPRTDYTINAKRDNSSEAYKILISIQSTGETSISITPVTASNMRYYGKITNK